MNEQLFWNLINGCMPLYNVDDAALIHKRRLTDLLRNCTDNELLAFGNQYERQIEKLCSWELWAAAWLVPDKDGHQYCGDSDWLDFLDRLVSRGQTICKEVELCADVISELDAPELLKSGDCFSFIPQHLLRERHSEETFHRIWDIELADLTMPKGEFWNEDDTSYFLRVVPKCSKKWGIPSA